MIINRRAGGITLPALTNPAAAADIASGKEAIDQQGAKLTGTGTLMPTVYYTRNMGTMYFADMVSEATAAYQYLYDKADDMVSISMPNYNGILYTGFLRLCYKLASASFPRITAVADNVFRLDTALNTVQLGSIGYPISSINASAFYSCSQSDLAITIYVADDASLPLRDSPWGATGATIIYRSSTTGEVISV